MNVLYLNMYKFIVFTCILFTNEMDSNAKCQKLHGAWEIFQVKDSADVTVNPRIHVDVIQVINKK